VCEVLPRREPSERVVLHVSDAAFQVTFEIEPPTRPDLKHARHQIGVLSPVAHAFLIPDNHIGRATVSSIAVANEVQAMGGRSIACLNARDRNLLGFRRDLLTAAAYGVDQFLLVHGDKPSAGDRTGELTVRAMIDEARAATDHPSFDGIAPFQLGVTARHHGGAHATGQSSPVAACRFPAASPIPR
jgi:methylenetetrahydrofolate reductase (NADPH)